MITNVSVFVMVRGPSLIVTSNGISPNGHDSSPEKPTRGVLEYTRIDLIDGFNFRKQCSYITLHELSLSKYALFTYLPDIYTLITTGSDEPSFGMGGNVISPVPLSLTDLFFSLWSLSLTIRIKLLLSDALTLDIYLFRARSLHENSTKVCLCELLLFAKVRSKLCFEIFVIKDATCSLTVPPYSGRVFKGIGSMLPFVKVDGMCPPCGRLAKLPSIGGFPSEFAEGSPWAVH
ncbi:hypothetical protein Tco_0360316 [Tanacetum coccineum]